ncbi:MAG: EamA family transporter [Prevotella sp.]|jgi:undecaprenyl phosphate-alpha-L-ara4N flippase subunit ArnE
MWKIVIYATLQSLMLVAAQVFLKFALLRMAPFGWNRRFWLSVLTNWQFALSGVFFAACSLLWMYMLKHFPFSTVYPLISLSYAFGMVASILFFHEAVSLNKWLGVALIMLGCFLITR